jgi:hypothetical protein
MDALSVMHCAIWQDYAFEVRGLGQSFFRHFVSVQFGAGQVGSTQVVPAQVRRR